MIALADICASMAGLTGDAVKVAVVIATVKADELRADAEWIHDAARMTGLHVSVVRSCIRELRDLGVLHASGRNLLTRDPLGVHLKSSRRGRGAREREARTGGEGLDGAHVEARAPQDLVDPPHEDPDQGLDPNSDNSARAERVAGAERHLQGGASAEREQRGAEQLAGRAEIPPQSGASASAEPSRVDTRREDADPSSFQGALNAFQRLYVEAYAAKPTWTGKTCALLKRLGEAHGYEEVVRRAGNMFLDPPDWPPAPHDMSVLYQHFDRFALAASRVRKRKGSAIDRAPQNSREYYGAVNVPGFEDWDDRRDT